MIRHLALLSAIVLAGCPQPPVVPPPDASDAVAPLPPLTDATPAAHCPDWTAACQALSAAGCQLGTYADCPAFMARDFGSGKVANKATGAPIKCDDIAAVHTKADAQRLGFACP